jgi:hypothetical protein
MHKISSHCKFVSVTEWHCVQPSYGEPKLNGFLLFLGVGGGGVVGRVAVGGIGLFLHRVL